MTSVDLDNLRRECAALDDVFHQEVRYFPEPLALLHMLFGASGYRFSRDGAFIKLKMTSTGMEYTIVSDEGAGMTAGELVGLAFEESLSRAEITLEKKNRLARFALQSLPPRRIADILFERSENADSIIGRAPFAPVPSRHRHPALYGGRTSVKRSRETEAEKVVKPDQGEITVVECSMNTAGKLLWGYKIITPKQTIEPLIFCESAKLSKDVAVLAALCRACKN
jgi:hypothetical protein